MDQYGLMNANYSLPTGFQNQHLQYGPLWNPNIAPGGSGRANGYQDGHNAWNINVDDYKEELIDQRKKAKQRNDMFKKYFILMTSFFVFPPEVASFYTASELIQTYLDKLGVNDEGAMLFLFVIHGVNIRELANGRFKLVNGYQIPWLIDVYDYVLSKLEIEDFFRLGTQMLLPQTAKPVYTDR